MENIICDDCNGRGWIVSLNDSRGITEIQRCDTCQIIDSDEQAGEIAAPIISDALELAAI